MKIQCSQQRKREYQHPAGVRRLQELAYGGPHPYFCFVVRSRAAGLAQPLADEKMVLRLEPIIFVIIGYYFGRLPGQQNEKTLRNECGSGRDEVLTGEHGEGVNNASW